MEETKELLRSIYALEQIQDQVRVYSARGHLFMGLEQASHRVFPVHQPVSPSSSGVEDTRMEIGIFQGLKTQISVLRESVGFQHECPKLDASVAKVLKKYLSFEDMGLLKDPLDQKMDAHLKPAWESSDTAFYPGMTSTCATWNLVAW